MNWYPDAIRKPLTADKDRQALTVHNRVNLHIAVSESESLYSFFNQRGIADSHFYVRRDGKVEQYVSTSMRAYADLEGNDATISIETQGFGGGTWTVEQRESLARIYAWAVRTHDVARKLATDSKIGDSSKGLSWHRLGIDGDFPALPSIRAGRLQRGGGMHYSTSTGKACPGDDRIPQIPMIFERAMDILNGSTTITEENSFMADLTEKQQTEIYQDTTEKVYDAATDQWDTQAEAQRKTNVLLRRVLANQVADQAAPTVDVDADAVAEALLTKLTPAVAQGVADALAARLAD